MAVLLYRPDARRVQVVGVEYYPLGHPGARKHLFPDEFKEPNLHAQCVIQSPDKAGGWSCSREAGHTGDHVRLLSTDTILVRWPRRPGER